MARHMMLRPLPNALCDQTQPHANERLHAEHEKGHRLQSKIANVHVDLPADAQMLAVACRQELALVAAREACERNLPCGIVAPRERGRAKLSQLRDDLWKAPAIDELPHLAVLQLVAGLEALDFELDVHSWRRLGCQRPVVVPGGLDETAHVGSLPVHRKERRRRKERQRRFGARDFKAFAAELFRHSFHLTSTVKPLFDNDHSALLASSRRRTRKTGSTLRISRLGGFSPKSRMSTPISPSTVTPPSARAMLNSPL